MNTTTLTNGQRVIAQLTDTNGTTEEITARFIGHWDILHDLRLAHFLIQSDGAMWTNLIATSEDGDRWTVAGSARTLTVRPERRETIAQVVANVTDQPLNDAEVNALVNKIILLLGLDPDTISYDTTIGEDDAERVYNEIGFNLEEIV